MWLISCVKSNLPLFPQEGVYGPGAVLFFLGSNLNDGIFLWHSIHCLDILFTVLPPLCAGSLSHWTACSPGHDSQLSAETGRQVHNFLPAQLWQARLLQGQAGENISCFQKLNFTLPLWERSILDGWLIYFWGFPYLSLFQCESSLVGPPARCWCVSAWNGKKLPGSSDLVGDAECYQEVTHWGTNLLITHKQKQVWTQEKHVL